MPDLLTNDPRPADSQPGFFVGENSGRAFSFRDPSGFIFLKDHLIYRQVNQSFREHFDFFTNKGLYQKLTEQQLLIPHYRILDNLTGSPDYYATLLPDKIDFISYPWEWSFDMLKDAALLTLRLAREAAGSGMVLKDATPYNIQWHHGKMICIDTLSFEIYNPEEPWIAYRQFCENFLAPLLLMHYNGMALQPILLAWPEGIPLPVAKSLLPWRSKFSLHTYLHIHLHAKIAGGKNKMVSAKQKFSKQKLLNLFASLEIVINKLKAPSSSTTWSSYYDEAAQRNDYLDQKKKIISNWLEELPAVQSAADLGANDGEFSKLLTSKGIRTLAADADPFCINKMYNEIKSRGEKNIQPLVVDLSAPPPAVGMNNKERASFLSRIKVDLALALALLHHLVIGKNIPFDLAAELFQQVTPVLIIEFVPKEDEKLQLMLRGKKDIYTGYTQENFEKAFGIYFRVIHKEAIAGSGRTLYLMNKHEG